MHKFNIDNIFFTPLNLPPNQVRDRLSREEVGFHSFRTCPKFPPSREDKGGG